MESGEFKPYGIDQFQGHSGAINDIAWASIAGRSFHMIATCGNDKKIIVHKMITKEFLSDTLKEEPKVTKMYTFDPSIVDPNNQR